MVQALWKTVWRFLRKLQIGLPKIEQFYFWVESRVLISLTSGAGKTGQPLVKE